ncbi:MAG: transglutaminase family protein [Verrucomicrobiia bacterium]
MNLLCAEGLRGAENLNLPENLDTLDLWARHVDVETFRNLHRFWEHPETYNNSLAYYRMIMLATVLQEDMGVHYNPERALPQLLGKREPNDVFFGDAGDVFINGILGEQRQGTCSSLPVLYVAVAQRLGYPVDLASTEEHLYLRYEEGTNHLNVDAAGEGFITHSDQEYRKWPHSLTDEEIKTYGYLQPMSKQQILGAFLTIRAANLTSAKKFDEAADSWEAASHYLSPTPVLQKIVAMAKERASDVHKAERWDELWDAVVTQPIPEDALDYFQNRQAQILLFMESSTDLAAMERAAADLKSEVAEYAKEKDSAPDIFQIHNSDEYPIRMTNNYHKVLFRVSLVPPPLRLLQIAEPEQSLADDLFPKKQRMIFPAELVPPQYWQSTPLELLNRLQKLNNERDMVEEMNVYAAEEARLQNLKMQDATRQMQFQTAAARPFGQNPGSNIRSQDLPLPWRGKPVPQELQDRIASLNQQNAPQSRIKETIDDFFIGQDQQQMAVQAIQSRRSPLDQQPVARPPFQLEIVPKTPASAGLNLLLTNQLILPINLITNAKGKP